MEKIERLCQSFHGLNKRKAVIVGGIVLVFVVLGCIICSSSKGQQTDLKKLGLKGNVEFVAEYHYSLELQNGILVENPMQFDDENGIVDYTESFYNKEGMLDKYRIIWDVYMNTDKYVYENGLLKEIRHTFNADREPEFTRFAYNDRKQLIRKTKSRDGKITKTTYKYDDKGNMIHDGEYEYTYNRKGRLIVQKSERYQKEVLAYNNLGKEKEVYSEFTDPTGYYDDYETKCWIKYDKRGRICEEREIEFMAKKITKQSVYTYTYEDDDKGNWIVKTTCVDGEPSSRIRRRIIYHDKKTESYDHSLFPLRIYVKEAYESGMPYEDFLENDMVKEFIVGWKSQKFYDYALQLSDGDMIFHRDVEGEYHINTVNKYNGCGSNIICRASSESMIYADNMTFDVYLMSIPLNDRGEYDIQPWQKGYHTDQYGEIIEDRPVYYLIRPFNLYSGTSNSGTENVQIMIDVHGIRFACSSFSNFSSASLRIVKQNGQEWVIPNDFSGEVVRVGWDNNNIFEFLGLFSTEDIKICIDCKFGGYRYTYSADFPRMEKTAHLISEYMYEVGAIDISRIEYIGD